MLGYHQTPAISDGYNFPRAKTPARALRNRAENAGVLLTKGKSPVKAEARILGDGGGKKPALKSAAGEQKTSVLGDKTPFPNRVQMQTYSPLLDSLKIKKPVFMEANTTLDMGCTPPDSVLRPSSTRRHSRPPRSVNRSFQTPANKGNYWDVPDISFGDADCLAQQTVEETEDDDEVEYAPPKPKDSPYCPPFDFDIPDYKVLGAEVLRVAQSFPYDDSQQQPEIWDIKIEPCICDLPISEECEDDIDDPFYSVRKSKAPKTQSGLPRRGVPAAIANASRSRPVSVAGTNAARVGSMPRPATSASVRAPASRVRASSVQTRATPAKATSVVTSKAAPTTQLKSRAPSRAATTNASRAPSRAATISRAASRNAAPSARRPTSSSPFHQAASAPPLNGLKFDDDGYDDFLFSV
ncbi:hypothetical protein FISHEDRAFT_58756 [Fistulina hepatica ATCC 64428]|uniref:Uncharacterized protein n=1 Tax=Fistulina hepatica ATCC 64428 TaxID=1128425 RepID=A0A0D7AE23_9AGAR|nr:hypothetical protein FISHEDRAFT_58756 [Fistulina hepatica ATCC 64428]